MLTEWEKQNVRDERHVHQRVEGIDELILEEILERRRYERTTLPMNQESLKGKVIVLEEEKPEGSGKRK